MTQVDPDFEARQIEWIRLFEANLYEDLIDATIADKILLGQRYDLKSSQIEEVLGWLRLAIGQVMEKKVKTSPECSFCGKKPPAVKLGAGPSAFICNECVEVFSGIFGDDAKT